MNSHLSKAEYLKFGTKVKFPTQKTVGSDYASFIDEHFPSRNFTVLTVCQCKPHGKNDSAVLISFMESVCPAVLAGFALCELEITDNTYGNSGFPTSLINKVTDSIHVNNLKFPYMKDRYYTAGNALMVELYPELLLNPIEVNDEHSFLMVSNDGRKVTSARLFAILPDRPEPFVFTNASSKRCFLIVKYVRINRCRSELRKLFGISNPNVELNLI